MKKLLFILAIAASPALFALHITDMGSNGITAILPTPQQIGNPQKGYEYLITGDYIKSGIPYWLYKKTTGLSTINDLQRTGKNATVPYGYNVVRSNGMDVVVPTCLQCHAQVFDGKLIVGLGNTTLDFSNTQKANFNTPRNVMRLLSPRGYKASQDLIKAFSVTFPQMQTEVRGANVAVKLAMVLAAHRDPQTLQWSNNALAPVDEEVYPVDVPAWWHLKKKNAMFYSGFARGDQAKFLMIANLLTVKDSAEAREVNSHFNDVLAYIRTITPPKFPQTVDQQKADAGKLVFNTNCSRCHGTYGLDGQYPNLLIPVSIVQTDSTICHGINDNALLVTWFRKSWFVQGENPAQLVPFNGYVAPPLDGIWVTAPYLHNGSVPTLEALLDSKQRPKYWSRDFSRQQYNYQSIGWEYKEHTVPERRTVYNTTLKGYSNAGHYFGDKLTASERVAVIEYLKTL